MQMQIFVGDNEVVIQDYQKVVILNESQVVLSDLRKSIAISGCGLYCSYFARNELVIKGVIKEIKLDEKK